jgi:hypothetical protein
MKNYLSVITNVHGDRFYMQNYHFFIKYEMESFKKKFDTCPIKEFFTLKSVQDLLNKKEKASNDKKNKKNLNKSCSIEKKFAKDLEICQKFINNDYVYVPYCISLVSSNKNVKSMEQVLECVLKAMTNTIIEDIGLIDNILRHITYEIPTPYPNTVISFYLPYINQKISIQNTQSNKTLPYIEYNVSDIFQYFSIENIILIHNLLILEQKVLFITNDYTKLSIIQEIFITLLYPLKWICTYIPILSEDMIKYAQSFMPFLMGTSESMINSVKSILDQEEIYLINVDQNKIELSSSTQTRKMCFRTLP